MPAPPAITGLANTLRDKLAAAVARANDIAAKADGSVSNLNTVLDGAAGVIQDVDKAAADVQAALGLSTNGGPPLDSPSSSSSGKPSSDSPSSGSTTIVTGR